MQQLVLDLLTVLLPVLLPALLSAPSLEFLLLDSSPVSFLRVLEGSSTLLSLVLLLFVFYFPGLLSYLDVF